MSDLVRSLEDQFSHVAAQKVFHFCLSHSIFCHLCNPYMVQSFYKLLTSKFHERTFKLNMATPLTRMILKCTCKYVPVFKRTPLNSMILKCACTDVHQLKALNVSF